MKKIRRWLSKLKKNLLNFRDSCLGAFQIGVIGGQIARDDLKKKVRRKRA
jgi:hypothetical protein